MGVWGEAWQPGQPAGGLGAARSQGGAQGQGGPVVPQRLELDPLALLGLCMEQLPSLDLAAACRCGGREAWTGQRRTRSSVRGYRAFLLNSAVTWFITV